MFFITSRSAIHELEFKPLSSCLEFAPIAAKWAEGEWGYIRNKGVEFREQVLRDMSHHVYIGFYAANILCFDKLSGCAGALLL